MQSDLFLRPLFTWRSAVASSFGPSSPVTRHVLLTLSLHMSERGDSCFPSIELLSEESGLSRSTVISHLKLAHEAGWIDKQERHTGNGQGWKSVEYYAQIPAAVRRQFREAQEAREKAAEQRGRRGGPRFSGEQRGRSGGMNVVRENDLRTSGEDVKRTNLCPLSADLWEKAWQAYPKRPGNNPRRRALVAWNARIRAGTTGEAMLAGVQRYARFCEETGKTGTEKVMMAATFFGPDCCYEQPWDLPAGQPGQPAAVLDWWMTPDGIRAKAAELGVRDIMADEMLSDPSRGPQRPLTGGEKWDIFKARVFAAAGPGQWINDKFVNVKAVQAILYGQQAA